jgi:flagellar motor protein MotB
MRTHRAVGLLGLIFLTSCINPELHREVTAANAVLREQLEDLTRTNKDYQTQIGQLHAEVARMAPLVKNAAWLKEQKELVDSILTRFKKDEGAKLPPGVVPLMTDEGLVLRVEGKILFGSGSDKLSATGQQTLGGLVDAVRSHPGKIRISGHTDSDPIKHSKWVTNMRLSVARALAVREYLNSRGLPKAKMSVAGYGEFQPVDPNDKAKNRRTEIVLLR